jgi:tRNA pseudouridine55 synthase
VLDRFRASFLQTPPLYSAKKIGGVAAYEKARKNEAVELKPVPVTVSRLDVLGPSAIDDRLSDIDHRTSDIERRDATLVRIRVAASAGFYVRSLAHDIGQALGCGAHLEALRRTRVGRFDVADALTLDRVEASGAGALIGLNQLLGHMPAVELDPDAARRAVHGNPIPEKGDNRLFSQKKAVVPFFVRLIDAGGTLVAVAERRGDGLLHPVVVLG